MKKGEIAFLDLLLANISPLQADDGLPLTTWRDSGQTVYGGLGRLGRDKPLYYQFQIRGIASKWPT